jgi:hypothetical protein
VSKTSSFVEGGARRAATPSREDSIAHAERALAEAVRASGRERHLWLMTALAWAQLALEPDSGECLERALEREEAAQASNPRRWVS